MKPIIVLAVIAVAGMTLGTGFLNNDINLWIQQFGVGSGDIITPTDHAVVDFVIIQVQDPEFGTFKNLVQFCEITPDDQVGLAIGTLVNSQTSPSGTHEITKDSEITCKITNRAGQIIAEGTVGTPGGIGIFLAGEPVTIPVLKDPQDANSLPSVFETHDVIVVIHANTYSEGDFPPIPPPTP